MKRKSGVACALLAGSISMVGLLGPASASPANVPRAVTRTVSASTVAVADNVYVQFPSAAGVTTIAVYQPAPGVSTAELAARLQAQGLTVSTATAGVAPLVTCGYGTATALNLICPPLHWARNGFTNPQIYYNDQSSSAWPEGTVISTWNSSPKIHVVWSPSGCSGISGTHCILVVDGGYGASGWTGQTYTSYNTATHEFIDGSVYIHYNDYYTLTSGEHRQVACQETGHSFGLGHITNLNSCMYSTTTTAASVSPDSDDYSEIALKLYP